MFSLQNWKKSKNEKAKISMITCYDYSFAKILSETNIDGILIGDSSEMVMLGESDTINSSVEKLCVFTSAVRKGAPDKFIVCDIPFGLMQMDEGYFFQAIKKMMGSGANAIKIEGVNTYQERFEKLAAMGVPVMGHLGLTPQHIHQYGGFKVQGKTDASKELIFKSAKKLEEWGAFAVVLECIPNQLAKMITEEISIPTIGIGAGAEVDGQILVLQDLLGMNPSFKPKFVRQYMQGFEIIKSAVDKYVEDVKTVSFPEEKESYEL